MVCFCHTTEQQQWHPGCGIWWQLLHLLTLSHQLPDAPWHQKQPQKAGDVVQTAKFSYSPLSWVYPTAGLLESQRFVFRNGDKHMPLSKTPWGLPVK